MVNQKTLMNGLSIAWVFVVAALAVAMVTWLESTLDDYSKSIMDVSAIISAE